jgi:hypothetical protein
MLMFLAMAPMGVEHRDGATPERLAPDVARALIQAWHPTAHEGAQHDCRVLVAGRAAHRRDRQDEMPRDPPLVEALAPLADPVIDGDFGAASAQRRWAAHRHPMRALTALQTAVLDLAHLVGLSPPEQLGYQAIVVGRLVA